ncbi:hypothetical protein BJY01DRAFT_136012 [Aspergillus pseudoustus]|uniref:Rhodopsin domain-containing protein n=1 Tax=Aspergillus pseudoustus TaxID=1810923 RepID=A0ABR4KD35_9EURO
MGELTADYLAQSKVLALTVCYSIPIPLEILSTGLRLWAELRPGRNGLACDDLLMIWATIVSVGTCIIGLVSGPPHGMGRHIEVVSDEDVKQFIKGDYVFNHFYNFAIASTKLSVLALYHRIFPKPVFQRIVILTAIFVVLWLVTMELVMGFECRPIARLWEKPWESWDSTVEVGCLGLVAFGRFTNITNLATDLWILALPLPIIFGLQISTTKKIGLSFLFSMGLATCGVSAARLNVLVTRGSSDFTYASVPLRILSVWEPLGGILCANLPICHKLIWGAIRRVTGHSSSSPSGSASTDLSECTPSWPRCWYALSRFARVRQKTDLQLNAATDSRVAFYRESDALESAEVGGIVVLRTLAARPDSETLPDGWWLQ